MTAIHGFVDRLRVNALPRVICRLPSGWAVLGDPQILRGYSLLYPDPVVPHLNALDGAARLQFLDDMARLGDAVMQVTGAVRINYEMLGNVEPALHAHVIPRYVDEPASRAAAPVWLHDWSTAPAYNDARDRALADAIARLLGNR